MQVFDGPPCSFQRSPGVLGSAGEASRELLEAYVWPLGALGGVLAEVSMTSEGPRGGLETEFVDPRGKWMMAKYTIIHIFPWYFDDFQKQCFFPRSVPGALMICYHTYTNSVFPRLGSPWGPPGAPNQFLLRLGGSPWSGQSMQHSQY